MPGAARIYPRRETFARFNDPYGFDRITSACSVMIYRDDCLGAEHAGNVFVCEPVHNLVHREVVRPACHAFAKVAGRPVGPDLAVVKDRSAPYLLAHILDPNRAVEDRYVFYTASTHDGRALAGMVTGEAGNSITLVGLDGAEQTILRSEIRSLVSSGRSLMPDGLEGAIDEQAMADLIAFLAGSGHP